MRRPGAQYNTTTSQTVNTPSHLPHPMGRQPLPDVYAPLDDEHGLRRHPWKTLMCTAHAPGAQIPGICGRLHG